MAGPAKGWSPDAGILLEVRLLPERVKNPKTYPHNIPAIRKLGRLPFHPQVTLLIGENGMGKSTLIEAIAIKAGINPEGGSQNFNFSQRATESALHQSLRLARSMRRPRSSFFLRAETMFNVQSEVQDRGLAAYGWQDMHSKSHGEAFIWVVQNRFRPGGLYILDEPESALSPMRQLMLMRLIHELAQGKAQFIISTHSPILMTYPDAFIYQLSRRGIARTTFRETEHYTVTRAFLNAPEAGLRELLRDGPEAE